MENFEKSVLEYLGTNEEIIFQDLERLVLAEASTTDLLELSACRKVLAAIIESRLGVEPEVYETAGGHFPLKVEWGSGSESILLIGHYDTACPIGSIPFHQEGNKLHGPGIFDMKAGLISAVWAFKAFKDLGAFPEKKLILLINGDEEIGSPESTPITMDLARNCQATIILESPVAVTGDLKTGRKGNMSFEITVHGKAVHAGNHHEQGINAIEEMCKEIIYLHTLTDYEKGTTVNVGTCAGGTKKNVVPDRASYQVDCRYRTVSEQQRLKTLILGMQPFTQGTRIEISGGDGSPPMEQTEGNLALFELAVAAGKALGLRFSHQFVGGGSDGNRLGAMGIPTLDGMGAVGDGAHAPNEHILIDQYLPRIALLASLLRKI